MYVCTCWDMSMCGGIHRNQRYWIPQSYRQSWPTCHGCWEPNLDPLQEQCTLLSISSPRNVESKGRALKSWVMGTEDIRYVPGGDQFKWKALAITVFCTSTVYVKAMQTDFFLNFRSIFNLEFSCVCALPVVGIFFCTSLLDEASKVKECGEHGIEFLELTGLFLYLVNQCLCSVHKNNCIFSYGRKTSQRLWKWLREWSACLGKA